MRNKKAQFYLIAAIIIIAGIITISSVTNYIYVKQEPKKFHDLGDILNLEGKYVIDNAVYNKKNVNSNIEAYLSLFSKYLEENTNEDFNLIVLYGKAKPGENITGKIYSRSSIGDVNINIGSSSFQVNGGETISTNTTQVTIQPGNNNMVNITITSPSNPDLKITQELPILEDNNFVFIMTTSSGFNTYVQNSIQTNKQLIQ